MQYMLQSWLKRPAGALTASFSRDSCLTSHSTGTVTLAITTPSSTSVAIDAATVVTPGGGKLSAGRSIRCNEELPICITR